jgi:hypothetical protein
MRSVHQRPIAILQRAAAALWSASFLFFLIYSAPHQVHHFFEQSAKAHHHDANHEHSSSNRDSHSSADSNCVFQVSASRCHLGLAWQLTLASLPILVRSVTIFHAIDNDTTFLPDAFQIRAPPLA